MDIDNRYALSCQPSISPPTRAIGAGTRLRSPARHREPSGLGQIPDGDGHEGSDGRRQQRRIAQSAASTGARARYAHYRSAAPAPTSAHMPPGRLAVSRGASFRQAASELYRRLLVPGLCTSRPSRHHPLRGASWTAGSTSFAPRWWMGLQSLTSRGKSRRSISSVRTTVRRRLGRTALEDPRGRGV